MIRGAGRLNKRLDERANYPTPVLRTFDDIGLYPAPPAPSRVLPGRVMDGRHLFEQEQEHSS